MAKLYNIGEEASFIANLSNEDLVVLVTMALNVMDKDSISRVLLQINATSFHFVEMHMEGG